MGSWTPPQRHHHVFRPAVHGGETLTVCVAYRYDTELFPNGIKPVADYIHSRGMLFGIYTARGSSTCMGRPGSDGHEQIDADTYAEWGVDYLKVLSS